MITVEDSTGLLAAPDEIWPVLADVPRWWGLYFAESRRYEGFGWGGTVELLGGEGAGMRFGSMCRDTVMQTMHIAEWSPPLRLQLVSDPWNPERAHISLVGKELGQGRLAQFVMNVNAVQFSIFIDLAVASARETKLKIRGEFQFLNPLADLLFSFQARRIVGMGTTKFLKEFPHLLE